MIVDSNLSASLEDALLALGYEVWPTDGQQLSYNSAAKVLDEVAVDMTSVLVINKSPLQMIVPAGLTPKLNRSYEQINKED